MIWLTWRQFRVQALTAAAVLAAVAILLGVTGPHMASLYAASGIAGCQGDSCANSGQRLPLTSCTTGAVDHVMYPVGLVLILATPALLGIFWGAPLIAREFETGTFRLAWNQSVTRTRWLMVKLALTGLAAMAVTEALSLMHAWWADPDQQGHQPRRRRVGAQREPVQLADLRQPTASPRSATRRSPSPSAPRPAPSSATPCPPWPSPWPSSPWSSSPCRCGSARVIIPPAQTITTVDAAGVNFGSLTASVVPGQPEAWVVSSYAINAAGQHVTALPASCFR